VHARENSTAAPLPTVRRCMQARWVKELSKVAPTLAFHASITNPFGKVRSPCGAAAMAALGRWG
jgi:hypothetical protein